MSFDIYTKIQTIKEDDKKCIYLVKDEITGLFYVERILKQYNENIFEILKEINHPYIPKIIEIKKQDQKLYIIEEYINAPTLDYYIINEMLSNEQKETIINQLIEAIDILHQHHIIHRDIKPENIFYDYHSIKLFDYDIAKIPIPNQNKDTVLLGSVGYAAPEQYGFMQSDERTDIYALGVFMNVLYTKQLPSDYLYKGKYQYIIKKATAIDPLQRYQSIQEIKDEIKRKNKKDDWTIPGFRKNKLSHKIIASIGYFLIFYLSFYGEYEDIPKGSHEEFISNLYCFLFLIFLVFYFYNYRNIQEYNIFYKNRYFIVRLFGHFFVICGVLMVLAIFMSIL